MNQKKIEMFNYACRNVPYFMDAMSEKIEICDSKYWEDVPILEKNSIVCKNDSFISAQYISKLLKDELLQVHTSGSTGKCINVFWDIKECTRSLLPLWMRRKRYYGINPHDKYCYFFTKRNDGKFDIEMEMRGFSCGFCKSNLSEKRLISIWEKMCEFEPQWLILQPSIAILLCRVIEKYSLKRISSLKYVETTGEMLFPQVRRMIEKIMCVMVANQYGCIELNSLAYECPEGNLHCMTENAVVEIVNKKGKSVNVGEEGDICVTTLTNYAMPLIRYRIGDRGKILQQNCKCGSCAPILQLTTGRNNDWVIDKDGNLINAYIFIRCVENVNKLYEHAILQFQVIQKERESFIINLVLEEEYNANVICKYFMECLWQESLETAKFYIKVCGELLPEEKTGKLRWFISDLIEGKNFEKV